MSRILELNRPKKKLTKLMIHKIFEFFKPEYLKILSWLSLNKVMKKSCVEIKKIKGNISKIKDGEFKSDKYIGIELSTSIF